MPQSAACRRTAAHTLYREEWQLARNLLAAAPPQDHDDDHVLRACVELARCLWADSTLDVDWATVQRHARWLRDHTATPPSVRHPAWPVDDAPLFSDTDADDYTAENSECCGHCSTAKRPVLVGDAESMQVGAGLSELIGESPRFRARDVEGLLCSGVSHRRYFLPRGQNAAARASPRVPVTTSFSSRPTGFMSTA